MSVSNNQFAPNIFYETTKYLFSIFLETANRIFFSIYLNKNTKLQHWWRENKNCFPIRCNFLDIKPQKRELLVYCSAPFFQTFMKRFYMIVRKLYTFNYTPKVNIRFRISPNILPFHNVTLG
jgi:hypothetical protein